MPEAVKEIISIPGKVCYNKARRRNCLTFMGNFSVNLEFENGGITDGLQRAV